MINFNSAPDYETKTSYSMTLNVSDGDNIVTQSLTVNITNLNDNSPQFSTWSCNSPVTCSGAYIYVPENQTTVGTIIATDADGDDITYSISGSDVSSSTLSINASTGVVTYGTAPNYENYDPWDRYFEVSLTSSDGTNSSTKNLRIYVVDVNEYSPVINSSNTFSAAENQTSVGTVSVRDDDKYDTLTYSLSGTDASSFSISPSGTTLNSSGVITFDSAPDYEAKNSYVMTVSVSDGTNVTSQSLTINVTNVNEAPVINTSNSVRYDFEENSWSTSGATCCDAPIVNFNSLTFDATDPEGTSLTYTTNLNGASISSAGVLTWDLPLDYDDVYESQNRDWSSFCQHYLSTPNGGVGWLDGGDDGYGCREGTIPRDNGINQFTITVSDGEFSTTKTFNYRITDDASDITVGWTTNDPPPSYRTVQGGIAYTSMFPTGINSVQCRENNSCVFRLNINSYLAPDDISVSMHSIQGTTADLSEFVWVYYNDWYSPGSCRKDFAEYGIGAQNVAVNSQSGGYVLKLDKDCFQEDFINGADYLFAFYMNPAQTMKQ